MSFSALWKSNPPSLLPSSSTTTTTTSTSLRLYPRLIRNRFRLIIITFVAALFIFTDLAAFLAASSAGVVADDSRWFWHTTQPPIDQYDTHTDAHYDSPSNTAPSLTTPTPHPSIQDHDHLDHLRNMVATTNGYFTRDYSLGLGWNNVRYIIEAALLQAKLLNRTAILPSFVYARACEYDIHVCADVAPMVNKGDAIGWSEWRDLPIEQQMGWRIPMSVMINMTHLRQHQPVLLTSEYLRLHNMSSDMEGSSGAWDRYTYHLNQNIFTGKTPDIFVIENQWFDPAGTSRVDALTADMKLRGDFDIHASNWSIGQLGNWKDNTKTRPFLQLEAALPKGKSVLSWGQAVTILQQAGAFNDHLATTNGFPDDHTIELVLQQHGWETLYTFASLLGMEYSKTVVNPIREVSPRTSLRGFADEYHHVSADVVILAGETHLERKAGNLRFTTAAARDDFSRIVLESLRLTDKVLDLADALDQRMRERNNGRMWMGAHMRRGDFVSVGWAMESTLEAHFNRIKGRLDAGRELLNSLNKDDMEAYEIPEAWIDHSLLDLKPPLENDVFYLATDERHSGNLTWLTDHGAVLMSDLLTIEDRRIFGWPMMIVDVIALVEQAALGRSAYFYGSAMSSVSGGVTNIRAVRGADKRTALLD